MTEKNQSILSPKCLNQNSKPSLFCPGCGQSIFLRRFGFVIDELKVAKNVTIVTDIGCSLLAWNYYNIDTVQSHHGRSVPLAVGYKMANPRRIVIAMMGDGGAYAIGLQSLIHAAFRNNPISAFVLNNTEYSMTGGQMAPTTIPNEITTTSPAGKNKDIFGAAFLGPELIKNLSNKNSFIARSSVSNIVLLDQMIEKTIKSQCDDNFSMLEVLSLCPTNWKKDAKESFDFLTQMEKVYRIGEIKINEKKS